MKIPKKFKLFGQTITVEYDEKLVEREDLKGVALYRENKIKLLPAKGVYSNKPQHQVEQTFLHEVCHIIMHYLCENDMVDNEKFIDNFSNMLHQFISTSEGELK